MNAAQHPNPRRILHGVETLRHARPLGMLGCVAVVIQSVAASLLGPWIR